MAQPPAQPPPASVAIPPAILQKMPNEVLKNISNRISEDDLRKLAVADVGVWTAFRSHLVQAHHPVPVYACPCANNPNLNATILHWAANYGHVDVIRRLENPQGTGFTNNLVVDQPISMREIDLYNQQNSIPGLRNRQQLLNWDTFPLHFAARNGHVHAAQELIRLGADVNAQSDTPSDEECQINNPQLIGPRYNRNKRHFGDGTPLWLAVDNGHIDMVKLLLQNGADIEIVPKISGQTRANGLDDFLHPNHRGSQNAPVVPGQTATCSTVLHRAARGDHWDIFLELFDHMKTRTRPNSQRLVTSTFWDDFVNRQLRQAPNSNPLLANANAVINYGRTALHYAAQRGNWEMCRLLVKDLRADQSLFDIDHGQHFEHGPTALQAASANIENPDFDLEALKIFLLAGNTPKKFRASPWCEIAQIEPRWPWNIPTTLINVVCGQEPYIQNYDKKCQEKTEMVKIILNWLKSYKPKGTNTYNAYLNQVNWRNSHHRVSANRDGSDGGLNQFTMRTAGTALIEAADRGYEDICMMLVESMVSGGSARTDVSIMGREGNVFHVLARDGEDRIIRRIMHYLEENVSIGSDMNDPSVNVGNYRHPNQAAFLATNSHGSIPRQIARNDRQRVLTGSDAKSVFLRQRNPNIANSYRTIINLLRSINEPLSGANGMQAQKRTRHQRKLFYQL